MTRKVKKTTFFFDFCLFLWYHFKKRVVKKEWRVLQHPPKPFLQNLVPTRVLLLKGYLLIIRHNRIFVKRKTPKFDGDKIEQKDTLQALEEHQ